jgi:glutaredoxin
MSESFDIQNDDREREILKALHDRYECQGDPGCEFCEAERTALQNDHPAFHIVDDEDVSVSKAITFKNGRYQHGS